MMRRRTPGLFALSLHVVFLALWIEQTRAKVVPLIQPGFFFDFKPDSQDPRIPITSQCETINLKWSRGDARGANPVAPYSLQIHTSSSEAPFIVPAGNGLSTSLPIPFAPGTLYQICMFDSNGTPGGCQATYTVVQNSTTQTPTCTNLTASAPLQVEGTVSGGSVTGPMSRFGVIDQCTDLSIRPKNGQPPFTLSVTPDLHPPYNLTSNSMDPIVWTASLSWSFQFFVTMTSADGLMWTNGPLHTGGFGPDDCLALESIPRKKSQAIAAGASVGSLFAGLLLGVLGALAVSWKLGRGFNPFSWRRDAYNQFDVEKEPPQRPMSHDSGFAALAPATTISEPLTTTTPTSTSETSQQHRSSGSSGEIPRAYVIHHDAGLAPVTVVAAEPTEFVELPPEYQGRTTGSGPQARPLPARSTSLPTSESEEDEEVSVAGETSYASGGQVPSSVGAEREKASTTLRTLHVND